MLLVVTGVTSRDVASLVLLSIIQFYSSPIIMMFLCKAECEYGSPEDRETG